MKRMTRQTDMETDTHTHTHKHTHTHTQRERERDSQKGNKLLKSIRSPFRVSYFGWREAHDNI